jgi:hypothetical protein
MRKLIIGFLATCLVNIISVKGNSLIFKTVNENPAQNERVERKSPLVDDDRSKNIRNEKKRLRKEKVKYRKLYRANKKRAKMQNKLNEPGARLYSNHREMVETRSVPGI